MRALSELFDLSGRVAVVTGGSRGLGLEMAEGLGEAGAALMLCARREQWLTPAIDRTRRRGIRVQGTVCDKASSPIARVGAAGELKGVAVFLAADASNYITGQVIVVDGGRSIS